VLELFSLTVTSKSRQIWTSKRMLDFLEECDNFRIPLNAAAELKLPVPQGGVLDALPFKDIRMEVRCQRISIPS
jgi:hypothetical protein